MKKQEVKFKNSKNNYSVLIGDNLINLIPNKIKLLCPNTKQIALIIDKKPKLGMIYAPAKKTQRV